MLTNYISKRQFGIEIEFLFPTWDDIERIVNQDNPEISLWVDPRGIAVFGSARQYNNKTDWKLTTESSVTNGDGTGGFEINSPILQGEAELQQLAQIINMLHHCGAIIDEQCGLHVHIEIKPDFNQRQLKNLLKLQLNLEDSFDCLIDLVRRRDNIYCESNVSQFYSELHNEIGIDQETALWTDTGRASLILISFQLLDEANKQKMFMLNTGSMFHKLNLAPLLDCGTAEIRSHHGTLDYAEITNWMALQMALVETAHSASQIQPETVFFVGPQKAFAVLSAHLDKEVIEYYLNR